MNRGRDKNKTIDIFIEKIKDIKIGRNEKWAIYGTGDGAEFIYEVICEAQEKDSIQYIIDRDDKAEIEPVFHGIPIRKLSEVCEKIDGIIIAAIDHHEIIKKRIFNTLTDKQLAQIRIIDIFTYNTVKEKLEYIDYIEKRVLKDKTEFVEFDNQGYKRKEKDTKIIAWYLPQYHQLEINNKFHGQGFTEWTNSVLSFKTLFSI